MNFIGGILARLLPVLLEWTFGKISGRLKKRAANSALKQKQDDRSSLAKEVEAIRQKIMQFESAGQAVPEELKNELREKSRLLIHS